MSTNEPSKPLLRLDQVTLVAVSSVAIDHTVRAIRQSMTQACFGRVLLLSDKHPCLPSDAGIEWRQIDPIGSRRDYSRFMLHELAKHVATTHALCVQWDGYILNAENWDDHFLDYDFIGAPWPHFSDRYNVGNGGFSLRSARLLKMCRSLPADASAEDMTICRTHRKRLESSGIIYAPEAVARRFSYERTPCRGDEFGFHGVFNMTKHLPSGELLNVIRSLEPQVLSKSEHVELLRFAITRREGRLALVLLRRLMHFL